MPQWSAAMISPDQDFDSAPLLRRQFDLDPGHGSVSSATLLATAQGVLEAYLNGTPVSDEVLTPGWTSYEWRLRYRSWDVTSLIQPTSVLGIALGNRHDQPRVDQAVASDGEHRAVDVGQDDTAVFTDAP